MVGGQTYVCNTNGMFFVPLTPPGFLAIQISEPATKHMRSPTSWHHSQLFRSPSN